MSYTIAGFNIGEQYPKKLAKLNQCNSKNGTLPLLKPEFALTADENGACSCTHDYISCKPEPSALVHYGGGTTKYCLHKK